MSSKEILHEIEIVLNLEIPSAPETAVLNKIVTMYPSEGERYWTAVYCYLYGMIQGKRAERAKRKVKEVL